VALNLPPPPSKRWYRVAVVVAVLGLLAALAWWPYATTRIFDAVEGFERTGPFGGPIELDETGTHTFWIEGTCLSCHQNLPAEYRGAATVSVIAPDGSDVTLRPAPARVFNTARREGRSLWLFDVETPGVHRLSLAFDTSADDWDNTAPSNVAISPGNGLPVQIVRPMFVLGGGGVLTGIAIAVVTALRRRRYYERSAEFS
jgi:hypothetical protein